MADTTTAYCTEPDLFTRARTTTREECSGRVQSYHNGVLQSVAETPNTFKGLNHYDTADHALILSMADTTEPDEHPRDLDHEPGHLKRHTSLSQWLQSN